MGTEFLVLDEPTTGQDARGVRTISLIIEELATAGRTVIAISHDMRFVAEAFDRVVVMRAGRITADGRPVDVFAEANWPALHATNLRPTYPATVGARRGLGSTPTEAAFVEAARARARA
jgi:energy-coupling factor transport system ATP-binding protein